MSGLYEQVMGVDAWLRLPPVIRAIHSEGEVEGTLAVRRGAGLGARLLGWLLGFPPAAAAVPIRLTVARDRDRQVWTRWFGERTLRTWQRAGDGVVEEIYGPFVVAFRPTPNGAGLDHVEAWAAVRVVRWRLRMPWFLSPRVTGSTAASGDAAVLAVQVAFPGAGLLLAYEGTVRAVGSRGRT